MQNSENSKGNAMDLIQQLEGKVREKNRTIEDLEESVRQLKWSFVKEIVKEHSFKLGVLSLVAVESIVIIGISIYVKYF